MGATVTVVAVAAEEDAEGVAAARAVADAVRAALADRALAEDRVGPAVDVARAVAVAVRADRVVAVVQVAVAVVDRVAHPPEAAGAEARAVLEAAVAAPR
jgi:hypothetical protein